MLTMQLGLLTVTFVWAAAYAKYLGNDNRDVALLGGFSGLMGVCTAATAFF